MFIKLWMQQDVITVDQETSIGEAKEITQHHNFRHLPVVEGKKLIGIITQTDINKALPAAIDSSFTPENRIIASHAKVSSFMVADPVTVHPMDPLEKVALLMQRFKIGAVPVIEDEQLIGIITESDIFKAFAEILSGDEKGARIEMQIGHETTAIHTITEICKQFEMNITAITLYRNFSPDHQLLTIRVNGREIEKLIDALWKSGAKVNRVSVEKEN
ncbi:MAG TPA: CBS domain-containing protein [Desulfobacterales bacterium]|nr:CBS domain-containing protein [Desulfobacterales bacterium]HIP40076.1 CBS domain-containing protein [Desulfocapsa sulfexigens]